MDPLVDVTASIARGGPLLPLDIVLCGAPAGKEGLVSGGILRRQRRPGEGASEFSHAGVIGRGGAFAEATIIEQTWPRMREISLARAYGGARLRIYRLADLDEWERDAAVERLRARAERWHDDGTVTGRGERYGTLKILAFLGDSLLGDLLSWVWFGLRWLVWVITAWPSGAPAPALTPIEVRLLTRLNFTGRFVCSQVVAQAYAGRFQFVNGSRFERQVNGLIGWLLKPLEWIARPAGRLTGWLWNLLSRRRLRRRSLVLHSGLGVTPDDIADACQRSPVMQLIADVKPAGIG
jgi:hypothetical protein